LRCGGFFQSSVCRFFAAVSLPETDKRVKHEKQFLIEVFLSLKMLGRRTLIGNHPTQRKPLRGECGQKGAFAQNSLAFVRIRAEHLRFFTVITEIFSSMALR